MKLKRILDRSKRANFEPINAEDENMSSMEISLDEFTLDTGHGFESPQDITDGFNPLNTVN